MKKALYTLLLVATLFAGITLFVSAAEVDLGGYELAENSEVCEAMGDIDADGKVTAADARAILRKAVALETFSNEQKLRGDLNQDNKIDSADARLALRIAVKLDKQPGHIAKSKKINATQTIQAEVCACCEKIISYTTVNPSCHLSGDWITVKSATCSENGLKQKYCVYCDKLLAEKQITASHTYSSWEYQDGYSGRHCTETVTKTRTCTVCGYKQTAKENPYGSHTFGWIVTQKATCSQNGTLTYMCAVCGELSTNVAPKQTVCTGVETVEITVAPTCTKTGVSTTKCSVCGEVSNEEEIPALGHTPDYSAQTVKREATHFEDGIAEAPCVNCGETQKIVLKKQSHELTTSWTVIKPASCEETGLKQAVCKTCSTVTEEVPAVGHKYGSLVTVTAATCVNDGEGYYECTVCHSKKDVTLRATGIHSKSSDKKTVKQASCTNNEWVSYYCTLCDKYEGIYQPEEKLFTRTDHSYNIISTTPATCTTDGVQILDCSVCGADSSITLSKYGHDYVATTTAPTCTEQGYTTHDCSRCDSVYVDSYVDALGHSVPEDDWTTTEQASCTKEGTQEGVCGVCTETVTRPVEKVPHNCEWQITSFGTITNNGKIENGTKSYVCTVCGETTETQSFEFIKVLGDSSIITYLPDSNLDNDSSAVLYFSITDTENSYDVTVRSENLTQHISPDYDGIYTINLNALQDVPYIIIVLATIQ